MSVQEGGSSARLRCYHSRIELISINNGEEESVRAEASERNACKRYSREGPRGRVPACAAKRRRHPFSWRRVSKQTRLERNGKKQENVGRSGTPESRAGVCSQHQTYRIGQKLRSERGVTAAVTFAGPHYTYQRSEQDAVLYFVSR